MDCEKLEPLKNQKLDPSKKLTKLNEALLKAKPLFNPGKNEIKNLLVKIYL